MAKSLAEKAELNETESLVGQRVRIHLKHEYLNHSLVPDAFVHSSRITGINYIEGQIDNICPEHVDLSDSNIYCLTYDHDKLKYTPKKGRIFNLSREAILFLTLSDKIHDEASDNF